ncbi:GAF domain-containing protein [Anaeromyxobacter oryzae]|uniref:GAF domain-containing protein n=1 Tax=Anaeromyxobacter oryzae TaxID=2918170 RepID=A0ABM7WZ70_9BACT|nr:GAF domain-containing protein [Anaeromyxobacter oryzae]BDG04777.1 hypothetical protein AMOR_37730 [Anaeromyxobacter oryzae]
MASPHGSFRFARSSLNDPPDETPRGDPAALTPDHLARLLDLSRALSGAFGLADVAIVAAERGRVLTGASATQIVEVREADRLAVIAEDTGRAPPSAPRSGTFVRAGGPEHDVARSGEPAWLRSRAEASERCPNLALEALTGGPDGAAWAVLPLVADDEVNGVLTLVFDEVQGFDGPTRAFLCEVAAACGSALARGSLFTRERSRANASEEARAAGEVRERLTARQIADRTRLYERERFARARAEAETIVAVRAANELERDATAARDPALRATSAHPLDAFVVQYEETGVDGPVAGLLGVFSSEATARDALRELDRSRSLAFHASITAWTLDVPGPRTRVEIDLS